MTIARWILLLLSSLFISGCGLLDSLPLAEHNASATATLEPPGLSMLRGDIAFLMDRGSYCWITSEGGICADVIPPVYNSEMHTLVIGPTLELLFAEPFPDTVTASLHPGSNLMTRVPDIMADAPIDDNGRVLVTVPDDVSGNYVLVISALWAEDRMPHGSASYTTAVRF